VSVRILIGDVRARLKELPDESVHCVVTSPPYWGLRSYLPPEHPDKPLEIGLERTLGEHLDVMVNEVFAEVWRVLRKDGTCWVNYGDCYATSPNGRSAAATKAAGNDDRTFRDKPFSTIGPIYPPEPGQPFPNVKRRGGGNNPSGPIFDPDYRRSTSKQRNREHGTSAQGGRVVAAGLLKPKDLCMIPNRLAIAMQDWGWWVRSEIIWAKPNPMPESVTDRPAGTHEKVWLFTKSQRYWYDADAVLQPVTGGTHARVSQNVAEQIGSDRANGGSRKHRPMKAVVRSPKIQEAGLGIKNNQSFIDAVALVVQERNLRNVWNIPTAAFSGAHFATFPPALVEICAKAGCPEGGIILDPFLGAGTTAMVADRLRRDCIGIELNEESAGLARARIKGDAGMFAEIASVA
jgi:DNA modification methylase